MQFVFVIYLQFFFCKYFSCKGFFFFAYLYKNSRLSFDFISKQFAIYNYFITAQERHNKRAGEKKTTTKRMKENCKRKWQNEKEVSV